MVFQPLGLPSQLKESLRIFLEKQDFPELYKAYRWKRDTYSNGFPDIAGLEARMRSRVMDNAVTLEDVVAIAKWGELRNIKRVKLRDERVRIDLYQENGHPLLQLAENPLPPLISLQEQVTGFGPTYLTKTLRFSLPHEYGALDTRIVRLVGCGDSDSKREDWLKLKVRNDGYGWYISKAQSFWPRDYARWLNILRFFAQGLNSSHDHKPCPHPARFSELGLREGGLWVCADVEMALFSFVSQFV